MLRTWKTSLHSGLNRIRLHWGLRIWLLAAASLNLVATQAWASPPTAPSPSPIPVTREDFETLTFGRLVARSQSDSQIGISGDEVRVPFIEELRRLGYPALGAESLVFGQDKSNEARLELGGSITELVCSNPYGTDVRCRTAVNWELYDRKRKLVIYKVLTRATAAGGSRADIGHALLTGALRSLLSRARFVDSVRKPKESNGTNSRPFLSFRSCSDVVRKMPSEAEPVLNGVVVVEVGNSLGSGVLLSPDGLVLTAAHVVDTEGEISILGRSGAQTRAHVVRFNRQVDVALLAPEGPTDTGCLPTRSTPISVGEDLYAVGSPASRDLSFSLTRGIVSGTRQIDGVPLIQLVNHRLRRCDSVGLCRPVVQRIGLLDGPAIGDGSFHANLTVRAKGNRYARMGKFIARPMVLQISCSLRTKVQKAINIRAVA